MTWTDEDVLGAVAAALLPELRGRTHEVLRWVERPGELRRTDIAVPLGLQARLREASLWQRAERCLRDSARRGYRVVPIADPTYPPLLKATESPPIVLWVQGRWPLPETPLLAVVGSRRATVYGKNAVRFLLEPLVGAGVGVVSGMAVGVDAAAHQLCIEREGYTAAVLGHGLDVTYPREHRTLRERLLQAGGTLISEYPPDTPPRPELFPVRNRVISGLTPGVLVVEAPPRSGALNTARWALAQGREVLAVPGSIFQETSLGTNYLIQQGLAHMVLHWRDIVQALPPTWSAGLRWPETLPVQTGAETAPWDDAQRRLLEWLPADGDVGIETLLEQARQAGIDPERLYEALFELELRGVVISLPGRRYARRPG